MSNNPLSDFQHYIVAGLAGIVGVITGVRVNRSKIDDIKDDIREIKDSQVRLERKVDRWIEREHH